MGMSIKGLIAVGRLSVAQGQNIHAASAGKSWVCSYKNVEDKTKY